MVPFGLKMWGWGRGVKIYVGIFLYCSNHGEGKDDSFGTFGLYFQNFSNEREALSLLPLITGWTPL